MASSYPDIVERIARSAADAGGRALLVGGVVRDELLDLPGKDYDFEVYGITPAALETLVRGLAPSWIDTVGESFGVIKTRFGAHTIDISIPRRDSKQRPGHRGFEITGDPHMAPEDAARRRDFTINAMAKDPLTGELLDFFDGQGDLRRKLLRATDPNHFGEDPLRVLRGIQFAARFDLSVDPATIELCRSMTHEPEFADLPSARIGEEWRKLLLKAERPSIGLQLGLEMEAWQVLHAELAALVDVPQDPTWHPEGDVWVHNCMVVDAAAQIVRREELDEDDALAIVLGALCHDFGKPSTTEFIDDHWRSRGHERAGYEPTASFLARLEVGKEMERRVRHLVGDHLFPAINGPTATDSAIRRLAKRLSPATIQDLVLVAEADHRGRTVEWDGFPAAQALVDHAERLTVRVEVPKPLLQGRHLIDLLGWEPGPHFGPILAEVEEAQIDGRVATLEEALAMAKTLAET